MRQDKFARDVDFEGDKLPSIPERFTSSVLHVFETETGAFDYARYQQVQTHANLEKIDKVWATEANIRFYSDQLRDLLARPPEFGLCHGTRRGLEQAWFAEELGCEVLGTEISPSSIRFKQTINWDFHDVKSEWIGNVDFIYSNSLDHSYDPSLALQSWGRCLKPGGLMLLEWSDRHEPDGASEVDPFGMALSDLLLFIDEVGAGIFGVSGVLRDLPVKRSKGYLCCVVVRRS